MKINEQKFLRSSDIFLVPYSEHHVPVYHEWMKDPEIQALTASEALSLEEEYAMQRSWRDDGDKLTFIITRPFTARYISHGASRFDPPIKADIQAEQEVMIGDVNLFISTVDEADDGGEDDEGKIQGRQGPRIVAEVELMIASTQHRRKGYGRSALLVFLSYVVSRQEEILKEYHHSRRKPALSNPGSVPAATSTSRTESNNFDSMTAKIGENNHASLRLFESLGFVKAADKANYFGEWELRLDREKFEDVLRGSDGKPKVRYQVKPYGGGSWEVH